MLPCKKSTYHKIKCAVASVLCVTFIKPTKQEYLCGYNVCANWVWYLSSHTCTQPPVSGSRASGSPMVLSDQSAWCSSHYRGIKGTWASQQQELSSDPWEATPPLISKVTFSHSNIKHHYIHSTQVTCWSLFQRRGSEEPDKNRSVKSGSTWKMSSVHNEESNTSTVVDAAVYVKSSQFCKVI